jgi:hypothetical protein
MKTLPRPAPRPASRRPLLLWLFVFWLLALGVTSLWRGLTLWQTRALLAELQSTLSPPMLILFVILYVLCGAGLVVSALGLWQRREGRATIDSTRPARALIVGYFAIAQAYTWLFVHTGLLWERRWVTLILSLAAVGLGAGALTWHKSREWLGL